MTVRSLLHDNVYANLKTNGMSSNGSLVAELLSFDLSQPKTQKQPNQELSNSLIDFEMEISSVEKSSQQTPQPFNNPAINESSGELINFTSDLLTDEHVIAMTASSGESRSSFASISSTSSNNIEVNTNSNKTLVANNVSKQFNKYESTGAIPKTPKPILSFNNRLHQYGSNEDELNRHSTNRKGFFKLSNFKSTFREKMRSFKDNRRISSNDESYDPMTDTPKPNKLVVDFNDSKNESSDEILAKYRAKSTLQSNNSCDETGNKTLFNLDSVNDEEKIDLLDESEIFNVTKRKIRRVLGSIDMITLPAVMTERLHHNNKNSEQEIVNILKV